MVTMHLGRELGNGNCMHLGPGIHKKFFSFGGGAQNNQQKKFGFHNIVCTVLPDLEGALVSIFLERKL